MADLRFIPNESFSFCFYWKDELEHPPDDDLYFCNLSSDPRSETLSYFERSMESETLSYFERSMESETL
ncbi:hypothetical protein LEP1GSC021_1880 [Leptospira noguchii str. 1993005606]|nr:hypothetical protein LEP1GSC021_1880 [Leptospira noguchii str. 1993005606]